MRAIIACLFILCFAQARATDFKHTVSSGYGFPNLPRVLFNAYGNYQDKANYSSSGFGPLHLKYEYRISNRIGLLASINHLSYKIRFTEIYGDTNGKILPNNALIRQSRTAVNARFNFHFLNPENHERTEFYAGLGLGYNFGKAPVIEADFPDGVGSVRLPPLMLRMSIEATLGYRRFVSDHIGFYAEAGIAKSVVQAGICARF